MNELENLCYLKSISENLESIKKAEYENLSCLSDIKSILKEIAENMAHKNA